MTDCIYECLLGWGEVFEGAAAIETVYCKWVKVYVTI